MVKQKTIEDLNKEIAFALAEHFADAVNNLPSRRSRTLVHCSAVQGRGPGPRRARRPARR